MSENIAGREQCKEVEHPLKEYWLVRQVAAENAHSAFMTIMNLPREEALEHLRSSRKRFNGDYLKERALIETTLRDEGFYISGDSFQPSEASPIYFKLSPQPQLSEGDDRRLINIPAHRIPKSSMTFTIEDSFLNYGAESRQIYPHQDTYARYVDRSAQYNPAPAVYSPEMLREYFDEYGFPEELTGQESARYIECQVWTHDLQIFEKAQSSLNQEPHKRTITLS